MPVHSVRPDLQTQLPPVHVLLTEALHVIPQSPQFAMSVEVSTQEPEQTFFGSGVHVEAQLPAAHEVPAPQTVPHLPQLLPSVSRFTHLPPQSSFPIGQRHDPPTQLFPVSHTFPQLPQLLESLDVSTHAPEQFVSVHVVPHFEPEHVSLVTSHVVPQAPQFFGSFVVSTHVPLQSTSGGVH